MNENWNILGISREASVEEIRAAYAAKAQTCHPEEKPEEFLQLKKEYKEALKYAKSREQRLEAADNIAQAEPFMPEESFMQTEQEQSTPLMDILENREKKEHEKESNTPAMQQFKAIFMDSKKRNNRTEWRSFFITKVFLDEQYEEHFIRAMYEFLQQQNMVPFDELPNELVVELAIVYALDPDEDDFLVSIEEYDHSGLYDWKNVDIFEECIANIWNSQENYPENYKNLISKPSFIRRESYDEYKEIREVALANTWDYKKDSTSLEQYKYTISMGYWDFVADDVSIHKKGIHNILLEGDYRHVCVVELYDYLLCKYGFPIDVCAFIYSYYEFDNLEKEKFADVYKDFKAHILELYPNISEYCKTNISADDYADELSETLKKLQKKYETLGWGKNFTDLLTPCYATKVVDWCEEEAAEVYEIVNSSLFQKYKYADRVVNILIISSFTITEAKIFYDIYNDPKVCSENIQIVRLLHTLFERIDGYKKQEQYLSTKEYEYDLEVYSDDFWEYFLSVAFGDRFMMVQPKESPIPWGFLYMKQLMLPTYMKRVYSPSVEWRLRFTNYDKETGRFGEARSMKFKINNELTVTIEFHYYYMRYYINEREVMMPVFDVEELFAYAADDNTFMLLLPITRIGDQERQRVYDRLTECLQRIVRFPYSVIFLACMIVNDNASIYEMEDIVSRHYIENLTECYRLDKNGQGSQKLYRFHAKYGCWEDFGEEMIGNHYRSTLLHNESDEEGWDMECFKESDLSLPYEVETKVHDFSGFKKKEKVRKLLEIFRMKHEANDEHRYFLQNNQFILVFGDRNRMQLRQHLATDIMLDEQMEVEACERFRWLDSKIEDLLKYAKEKLAWIGWIDLENFRTIPVGMSVSGTYYSHWGVVGKAKKADNFEKLFGKNICVDDLTHVIEYQIENRSEWDCGK